MQPESRQPTLAEAFALAEAGRTAEALAIISRLAVAGDPDALFAAGDIHWRGGPVPQDLARGREMFRRASDVGHSMSRRAYTNLLANGIAGPRDWAGALRRLREEAGFDLLRARMLALIEAMKLDEVGNPAELPPPHKLSDAPQVTLFPGAYSSDECDFLIALAQPAFEPSLVADRSGRDIRDPIRTSDASTIHWLIEDPATHALNRRLAALTSTKVEQGEALQILRYRPGQQYRAHCDWLGSDNRRILTALVYLNEGYEGGETLFVKTGLKVKACKGDVLVFRNEGPDGNLDPLSEHAGLPVTAGVKFLASRWIRERRHVP
jgi:prolyl 4-hydroxylase